VDWIHLYQDTVQRWALVKKAVKIRVAQKHVIHAYQFIEDSAQSDWCKQALAAVVVTIIIIIIV
jgi:hypothetical protein